MELGRAVDWVGDFVVSLEVGELKKTLRKTRRAATSMGGLEEVGVLPKVSRGD